MGLTFFDLYNKLHEADAPAAPPPPPSGGGAPPPPPSPDGGGQDPLAAGGTTPPPPPPGGGDAPPGDAPPAGGAGGKPKIIKITTVWDSLENVLGGKASAPKNAQHKKAQVTMKSKSLHT
jgi:hypothetical protein